MCVCIHMPHRSCSCSGGQQDAASPLGRPNHPFSDTHLLHPTSLQPSLPVDDPSTSRGQPCRRIPPTTQFREPQHKSYAGTLPQSGSQHQPGTICPGPVTQVQYRHSGFPLTPRTPSADLMGHRRVWTQIHHCWSRALEGDEPGWTGRPFTSESLWEWGQTKSKRD